jgi:hypothetical protein
MSAKLREHSNASGSWWLRTGRRTSGSAIRFDTRIILGYSGRVLALLLGSLLLGSPAPEPTDESVLYEAEAEREHGVFEPIEIPATPPRPTPPSLPEALEPPAEQPLPPPALVFDLPPPPPPPTGAGRLVGGSFAIGLGLAAASVVIVETARDDGESRFVATTFIPLGLSSIGIGTYLLVRGAKARANYNDWRAFTRADTRPTGEGLIVAGTMSTVIGGVTLVAASVQARDPDAFDQLLAPSLFAVAGTGIAVGVGSLTAGLLRRNRYRSWRQSTFLSAVPVVAPMRGGLGFGLVGRF